MNFIFNRFIFILKGVISRQHISRPRSSRSPFHSRLILCLLTSAFFAAPALAINGSAPNKTFIVGGDYHYPPYEFIDDSGNPTGYNVELTRAIAEVMGIDVEIRLGPWSEMRKALEAGTIDALQGIVFTGERTKAFDFTPQHAFIHQSIFYRRGSPKAVDMKDLAGHQVIVQNSGSIHDNLLKSELDITIVVADTHANALRQLASGKHDYAVVANLPGLYLGRKLHLSNIVTSGKTAESFKYCYAVKKGDAELLALINEGLSILKNTGRYQEIYDKWLGMAEPRPLSWKNIIRLSLIVMVPLLLVMCVIIIWNRTLKREVEHRTRELHMQQQQLIQADKMATLGILVSGVAHEINNPTSLLLLNTPVIMDAYEDTRPILEAHYRKSGDFPMAGLDYSRMREEIPSMLSEMLSGAKRIKRIVEDLKDFARQDNSSYTESVDINGVVRTAVRLVDNSIKKATDNFHVSYYENLSPIRGNSQRIEQVIVNLIMNSCQALDKSNRRIYLKTYTSPDRTQVMVEVRDEGTGIDPEHLPHLTDPFFTTKRDSGGTGLGLSVSANIVKEHNGTMHFTSGHGRGTTVLLSFPIPKEKNE